MNKGFTLIELLGVVALLFIIYMLIMPAINKVISAGEKTVKDIQIDRILSATYDYSLNNLSLLSEKYQKNYITISELIFNGYLDPIIDPKTNKQFPYDYLISIENVGSKYKNKNSYAKKVGDYLYKIEIERMDASDYISKKPQLYLEDMIKTDNGYITELDVNGVFVDANLHVYDEDNVEITNPKVFKTILYKDNVVDTVDTSRPGIYKINYVAIYEVEGNPYANSLIWNIIITDNEPPTLTLPNNSHIYSYDFDPMEGVSCIDNSGYCEIKYKYTTNGGVRVYTYTATDESGNKTTKQKTLRLD